MDFTYLKPKKVWPVVKDHPDAPGYRTVERWCAGTSRPQQWAQDLMAEELGVGHEEAAPPDWAERLKEDLITAIKAGMTMGEFDSDAEADAEFDRRHAELIASQQRLSGTARGPTRHSGGAAGRRPKRR